MGGKRAALAGDVLKIGHEIYKDELNQCAACGLAARPMPKSFWRHSRSARASQTNLTLGGPIVQTSISDPALKTSMKLPTSVGWASQRSSVMSFEPMHLRVGSVLLWAGLFPQFREGDTETWRCYTIWTWTLSEATVVFAA